MERETTMEYLIDKALEEMENKDAMDEKDRKIFELEQQVKL